MSTTTLPNPLSIACPRCGAEADQACKSKTGQETKVIHRPRIAAVGGSLPATKPKARSKSRTRRTRTTPKTVVTRKGINSATIGAFMDDLEKLRETWHLNGDTTISVVDSETKEPMTAVYDDGAWLVSMGA